MRAQRSPPQDFSPRFLYLSVSLIPSTLYLAAGLKAAPLQLCHRAMRIFFYCRLQPIHKLSSSPLNVGIQFVPSVASYKGRLPEAPHRDFDTSCLIRRRQKRHSDGGRPPIWPRFEPIRRTKSEGDNGENTPPPKQALRMTKTFSHVSTFKYGIFMVLLFHWKYDVERPGSGLLYG